jgi:hypothetical protein
MVSWSLSFSLLSLIGATHLRKPGNISQPALTKATGKFLGVGLADVTGCDGFMTYEGPDPKGLTIASLYTGGASSWVEAQENHREYAQKHGLNYFSAVCQDKFAYGPYTIPTRSAAWSKFALLQKLFDVGVQDVFWMDADGVFMNHQINLKDIRSQYPQDFVFTGDMNSILNAGHFFLRNSPWSVDFMKKAYRICPLPDFQEQGSMMVLLGGGSADDRGSWNGAYYSVSRSCSSEAEVSVCRNLISEGMRPHAQLIPQILINAYPGMYSESGPFPLVVHLAGAGGKEETLRRLTSQAVHLKGNFPHEQIC